MFDFIKFIETLDKVSTEGCNADKAFDLAKDYFHIGKIEITSNAFSFLLDFVLNDNYDETVYKSYFNNGYNFNFYKEKNYKYDIEQDNEIDLLLRITSVYFKNYNLLKRAEEAKFTNFLSKLPNAQGYIRRIQELLPNIKLSEYNSYFINIKGFGLVNKLFGSEEGDNAIVSFAKKLDSFKDEDEIIAHLGGDNFSALIKKERHNEFINLVTLCPITIKKDNVDKIVNLIGVIGYVDLDTNIPDYDNIISNASMACQYARNTKKIVVKLTDELKEMVISVKNIERTFKDELKNGNFIVYYQPKFDIKTGKIIGVEALARWMNNGKIVPPGMFVPILEKNGEIVDLDLYILNNLCKDISNFRNLGHTIVPASCNLSRRDFDDLNLEEKVIDIVKKYNVHTEDIVIEVTETTNLEENEGLARFINTMNENGILTAIDDFGTGYSSLSVLRDFKVSEIKIDRSFINRDILTNYDEIIIGSIIDMAKRLNIDVICEGVENKAQAEFLVKLGCNNAQGFLYSKPLPKLEFEALLLKVGTLVKNK